MVSGRRIPGDSILVLDGYNVLFAGRDLEPTLAHPERDLASAREALVRLVAEYQRHRRGRAWVVFDARESVHADRQVGWARLEVTFAAGGGSADDEIVRLVRELDLGRKLVVVTADRELRARVSAEKAETFSSRAFLELALEATRRPRGSRPTDMTTEDWLRYFGCDPPGERGC